MLDGVDLNQLTSHFEASSFVAGGRSSGSSRTMDLMKPKNEFFSDSES